MPSRTDLSHEDGIFQATATDTLAAMIKLIVVEDDPQMRARFERAFTAVPDILIQGLCATAATAMALLSVSHPDVLLVDLGLPDGNGIDVIRRAHDLYPECDIMVVTVFGDQHNVLASIEAGATGYLLKDSPSEDYVARVLELRNGGSPISPIIARQLLHKFHVRATAQPPVSSPLAERETEVLRLLAKGFSYQEIADLLHVSPHTIATYIKRLYQKLQVHSRGEAVFEAQRMGLLDHL
jgi:DNA-binding NarL/FixJ family response regulator